jgi:uncharacterized protein YndB with AHSA1/START domain
VAGGRVSYFMSGPDGEKFHGWWQVRTVEAPTRLELIDGFADDDGKPDPDMPTTVMIVSFTAGDDGTVMAIESHFPSLEAMEQLVTMGADEGMALAMGQIDAILAEDVTTP